MPTHRYTGEHKGYAFVTFKSLDSVPLATQERFHIVDGKQVEVKKHGDKHVERTGKGGGVQDSASDAGSAGSGGGKGGHGGAADAVPPPDLGAFLHGPAAGILDTSDEERKAERGWTQAGGGGQVEEDAADDASDAVRALASRASEMGFAKHLAVRAARELVHRRGAVRPEQALGELLDVMNSIAMPAAATAGTPGVQAPAGTPGVQVPARTPGVQAPARMPGVPPAATSGMAPGATAPAAPQAAPAPHHHAAADPYSAAPGQAPQRHSAAADPYSAALGQAPQHYPSAGHFSYSIAPGPGLGGDAAVGLSNPSPSSDASGRWPIEPAIALHPDISGPAATHHQSSMTHVVRSSSAPSQAQARATPDAQLAARLQGAEARRAELEAALQRMQRELGALQGAAAELQRDQVVMRHELGALQRQAGEERMRAIEASTRARQLQKERDDLHERSTCRVCEERSVQVALIPCGHACLCEVCAEQSRTHHGPTCPMCRHPYTQMLRIFLA